MDLLQILVRLDVVQRKITGFHLQTVYFGETPPCGRSCMSGAYVDM